MALDDIDWSQSQTPPSGYPDMTPQPPPPAAPEPPKKPGTVLDKAWMPGNVGDWPVKEGAGKDQGTSWMPWHEPPEPWAGDVASKAGDAFTSAFTSTGAPVAGQEDRAVRSVLTPAAQEAVNRNTGWFGRNIINPAATFVGTGIADLAGAGSAVTTGANETLLHAGVPRRLVEDLNVLPAMAPEFSSRATPTLSTTADVPPRLKVGPVDLPNPLRPPGGAGGPPGGGGPGAPPAGPPPSGMPPAIPVGPYANVPNPLAPRVAPEAPVVPPQAMPSYMQPVVQARQADRGGLLGPVSPTGVEPPRPQPPGYVPPSTVPTTAAEGRALSAPYYTMGNVVGDSVTVPNSVLGNVISGLQAEAPKPGPGQVFAKGNPIGDFAAELQQYKDKPMSLNQAWDLYRRIGEQVTSNYTSNPDISRALHDVQQQLRGDIAEQGSGSDPVSLANRAWSQSAKMADVEQMRARAMATNNPLQSVKTQVAKYDDNPKLTRGWSDEELAQLRKSGDTGFVGNTLRTLGGGLLPAVASGAVAGGMSLAGLPLEGALAAIPAALAGNAVREPFAAAMRDMQLRKLNAVQQTIGKGYPPPLPTGWTAPSQGP